MADWPDRLNRFIDALQAGRRPERNLASTPDELDELRVAASIAGAREDKSHPDPTFLRELRGRLHTSGRKDPRVTRSGLLRATGLWAAGVASGIGVTWGVGTIRAANQSPPSPLPITGFRVGIGSRLAS